MNVADKPASGDSLEGHGLSVSQCPDEWEYIAKLGGNPRWTLTPKTTAGARFLDWHAVSASERSSILAWAVSRGLAERAAGFAVSWYDAERESRVSMTLEDADQAQAEFDDLAAEFDGEPDEAPQLFPIDGWRLTAPALRALRRKSASLGESEELVAVLYCEVETDLVGVYWDDILEPFNLSAPRAVIFPSRLAMFDVTLQQLPRESEACSYDFAAMTAASPADAASVEIQGLPVERRIAHFASGGQLTELAAALDEAPESPAITESHKDLDGTIHYHVIDRAVLMANSGQDFEPAAKNFVECANLLRARGAPIRHHFLDQGLAFVFLDSDWSTTSSAVDLAQLMRDAISAGDLDVCQRLTSAHAQIGGLMPLSAAIKMGNVSAAEALLDVGSSLDDVLKDFGQVDILECVRSFGRPNSDALAAVVAARLMRERLRDTRPAEAQNQPARRRHRV